MSRNKQPPRRSAAPRQQPREPRQPGRSGNPAKRATRSARPGVAAKGRPLPQGRSFFTPGASPTRVRIERASAPVLVLFHRMPRPVFAALPLVLLVLGAFIPVVPLALVFLALALLLLGWLAYLSWPRSERGQKVMRLFVPLLVIAIGVLRVTRG